MLLMPNENKRDCDKATDIYKVYTGLMLYIAESILHEKHLAEDAVSEAFILIRYLQRKLVQALQVL